MSTLESVVELPLLDLCKPIESSLLSSLSKACKEWGFFYVTNHGIPKDLFIKICSISKDIFNLPLDTKLKLGPSSSLKTYTPHFIASPYFESIKVSGPVFFSSAKNSANELSIQQNSEFCEILEEYGKKLMEVSKKITEVLLMTLGDGYDNKFYNSEFSNCQGYLRIVNYTAPEKLNVDNHVEGLGMHTDMSCITIVYQDEVGGLQMRSKTGDQWIDVSPCENCLVVNVGDLLQAWSNERLRSSEHRVVLRKSAVNRLSLAFFWCFEDEKVVAAPDEVVGESNSRIYKSFVCVDYLKFRESNEKGKFDKIGYTVKDFAQLKI